ncbi:histidinol-phosphatase [Natribacillus halophilus]|uniref:Histidinol-phosphatase n=1 Tax=Natribacillus halophilus TaxID=549003 RepID=A0A1G8PIS9_9BACI|nr:histidinol-phosphatase [Natribacillus halophilus]SDI91720.1 histidinol-phosphatase (PHP family) [Natribacillus halophilus]
MRFDLHTHHERCGHAVGEVEDYVLAALDQGLDAIGISDHSPFFHSDKEQADPGIAMEKREFPAYVKDVLRLKEKYADRIEVLLGVEADFLPEGVASYRRQLQKYPLDYVIGSVHYTFGRNIFDRDRWKGADDEDLFKVKEAYFDLIAASARSGDYQVLGHIDAIKGFCPEITDIQTNKVENALQTIAEEQVAIEVNTSGKMKACGGWYPSEDILERACFYGVPVTMGSDAHHPRRVGDDLEAVRAKLKDIGFTEWWLFREKKPVSVAL